MHACILISETEFVAKKGVIEYKGWIMSHNGTGIRVVITKKMGNSLVGCIGRGNGLSDVSNEAGGSPLVICSGDIRI